MNFIQFKQLPVVAGDTLELCGMVIVVSMGPRHWTHVFVVLSVRVV